MGVGQIVDNAIALYRRNWRRFVPLALLYVVLLNALSYGFAVPALLRAVVVPGDWTQPVPLASGVGFWLAEVVAIFAGVLFTAAFTSVTLECLGMTTRRPLSGHIGVALNKTFPLAVATLLFWMYLTVMFLLSSALATVTLFGVVGIIPLIGLLIWRRPSRRRGFLRRLIVLTFPFGLLVDWYVRIQLYVQVIVLEDRGPKDALDRSAELVRGRWFRTAGVVALLFLVYGLLLLAPTFLLQYVFGWLGLTRGFGDIRLWTFALARLVALPLSAVVAPVIPIGATLLLIRLREEREGTDLHARLSRLHTPPDQVLTPALH
jgi:hypothetical protein